MVFPTIIVIKRYMKKKYIDNSIKVMSNYLDLFLPNIDSKYPGIFKINVFIYIFRFV